MKITFCLPANSYRTIAGGYKVVYEYSNRLAARGHEVSLVLNTGYAFKNIIKIEWVRLLVCKFWVMISPRWFKLDKKVKKISANGITNRSVPNGDAVFATAVGTAEFVKNLDSDKGKKYYLIQDYETWECNESYVVSTYKMGLNNIVISRWLMKIMENIGVKSFYLTNPIDTGRFFVKKPILDRDSHSIGILYHKDKHKGFEYSYQVIRWLKIVYPDLKVKMFGTPKRPENIDSGIEYIQNASAKQLSELYNSVRVFLCMSVKEGFGLTGGEAMACGCALVSTAYDGVFDYAIDGENSLIVPIKDVELAVKRVSQLFEDEELLQKISRKGAADMKKRTWSNAVERLEYIIGK